MSLSYARSSMLLNDYARLFNAWRNSYVGVEGEKRMSEDTETLTAFATLRERLIVLVEEAGFPRQEIVSLVGPYQKAAA